MSLETEHVAIPSTLQALVDAAVGDRSPAQARQIRWVAGELVLQATTTGPPPPARARGWVDPARTEAYLEAAAGGTLRRRGVAARPSSQASQRVRRRVLTLLAQAAASPSPTPTPGPVPALRERVDLGSSRAALAALTGAALRVDPDPMTVRAAAVASLVADTGMRSGELATLTPDDLDLAVGTVTYRPHPPAARQPYPPETARLSRTTTRVLAVWLEVRKAATARTPRTTTLWVSLAPGHDGNGNRRPPGMPLRPQGMRRAHARVVARLNAGSAGHRGPLPATLGSWRPATPPEGSKAPAGSRTDP